MVPQQPEPPDGRSAPPRTAPHASEATRLLCAGTYLDETYRHTVIEELYVHDERLVAPSFGFDAARVLAHALRAQRLDVSWAAAILALWIVSLPLTHRLSLLYLMPVVVTFLAAKVRGSSSRPYRRYVAWTMRLYARFSAVFAVLTPYAIGTRDDELLANTEAFWDVLVIPRLIFADGLYEITRLQAWIALALPLVVALTVGLQRHQVSRALAGELSRTRFPDAAADPAERTTEGSRFHHLRDRIRIEQRAGLVMYRADRPFCGAGTPYDTWSLSVELRPRTDLGIPPLPLDNQTVLDRIQPLLEALREPATARTPQGAAAVRDRLRHLQIDECVFLPVDGLPGRQYAPYGSGQFEQHRARAVEEGGETRRHFLRVQVGGWEEELVTTVFVRVHTQGGMLMLEVAPHVLRPVRPQFREADRLAHDYLHANSLGKAVRALSRVPHTAGRSVVTVWRTLTLLGRLASHGSGRAMPDGPAVSVRELGSDDEASLFQEMDHQRYLKTIQDRVANGVRRALSEAGYRTEEFEQKIINVSNGGVLIEQASGAFAFGEHSVANNQEAGSSEGTDSGSG
ncbi:hypothetical protein ADL12_27665 [Streptomyces regalis]|uniref:Uncharacterized protein n=1 Tax=Streptomyces regalis TaxID=68262 RepID=A0A101JNW2_9ACTN|nr:hypothetical protein ADL12_27665 [Streptomyces regalis]